MEDIFHIEDKLIARGWKAAPYDHGVRLIPPTELFLATDGTPKALYLADALAVQEIFSDVNEILEQVDP